MLSKTYRQVKGMTVAGFLFVILVIGVVAKLAIPLAPAYFNHYAIKNAMKDLAQEPNLTKMTKAKIRDLFQRKLSVNNIQEIKSENLEIEKRADDQEWLILNYEVRKHVIANIDAVILFNEEVMMSEAKR